MTDRGLNLVGYLDSVVGQGESARLFTRGLNAAGVRWQGFDIALPVERAVDTPTTQFGTADFPYRVTALWCNPDNYASLPVHDPLVRGRYTIGRWAWEVSVVPDYWVEASRWLDEIWVISDYVAGLITPVVDVPVTVMPLPIEVSHPADQFDRSAIGIDESAFLFLTTFDYHSTIARKNPIATISAYRQAFVPGEQTALLVKSVNEKSHRDDARKVREAAAGRDDIKVIDVALPTAQKDALIAGCDCYVGLHRAEGYGIAMAEAMAHGRPVIATGFSGNLSFMPLGESLLVDYEMTRVGEGAGQYPAAGVWAEPSVQHASALMREVAQDRDGARAMGERNRRAIAARFAPSVVGGVAADAIDRAHQTLDEWSRSGLEGSLPSDRRASH